MTIMQRAFCPPEKTQISVSFQECKNQKGEKTMKHNILKHEKLTPWFFLMLIVFSLSLVMAFNAVPRTWAAENIMEVYQQEGTKVFGQNTTLDIFNDPKYDEQRLIAPFSKGTYIFGVRNNSKSNPLPYILDIKAENPDDVPIIINVFKNGTEIFGNGGMLPLSELNLPETLLSGNSTDVFTINWMWETDNDIADTELGNDGTQFYTLLINAEGVLAESSVPDTGVDTHIFEWLAVMFASLTILFVLLLFKRKKRKDEEFKAST